jgi:uncharacterized metal-binding protein
VPETPVHDRITLISAGLLAPVFLAIPSENRWISWGVLTGSYLLSGLAFSCDLDIQAAEYRRWGPLRWMWWPYARMVLHRSWLSHGLVVGPLLRLIYFALVVDLIVVLGVAVVGLGGWLAGFEAFGWLGQWHLFWAGLVRDHPRFFADVLVGFVLGGAAHSIPDWLTTGVKRIF